MLRNPANQLAALLVLHVDDAMIFGNKRDSTYQCARKRLDERFDIKTWESLGRAGVEYLGQTWRQCDGKIKIDMDKYIAGKLAAIKEPKTEVISPEEVTEYRSAVVRLRWVIAHIVPELAYEVSALAQKQMDKLTPQDFKQVNKLYRKLM